MSQKTINFCANRLEVFGSPYGPQFDIGDDALWKGGTHWMLFMGGDLPVTLDGKAATATDVPDWFARNAAARRSMFGKVTTDSDRYDGVVALELTALDPPPEKPA